MEGLGDLVLPTEDGLGFVGQGLVWDSYGRTLTGPRAGDLVGYAGQIVDGEVNLFISHTNTIPGDPLDVPVASPSLRDLDDVPVIDLDVLPTLSYLGPIWRYLDATLVVENGVGSLCEVADDAPVPDLETCDRGVTTAVASTQPEITSWFFGPVLAEFDEFGEIVTIAPLGGTASRDDGLEETAAASGWRQVLRLGSHGYEGTPVLATDDEQYTALGAAIGQLPLPAVDFAESVVVAFATSAGACLGSLRNMTEEEGTLVRSEFAPAVVEDCDAVGLRYTFVVEIDRALLADEVRVEVPESIDDFSGGWTGGPPRTATFRSSDGALIADGLELASAIPVCEGSRPGLQLTMSSSARRNIRLTAQADGTSIAAADAVADIGSDRAFIPIELESFPERTVTVTASSSKPPGSASLDATYDAASFADFLSACR